MRVRDLEFTDGSVDLEKTARTREERETRRQARLAENERLEQLMAEKRARYSALNADIIELLKGSWGDFAKDMADTLSYSALSELSERQFNIVSDIYAKTFGRRNSKAYNTAYDAIWDRREG